MRKTRKKLHTSPCKNEIELTDEWSGQIVLGSSGIRWEYDHSLSRCLLNIGGGLWNVKKAYLDEQSQ